jgi:adenosylcobinamide-GDP ribazoletransferase
MLLVLLVVVTRGFHLDGFMDVCDGLFGGHTAEHRLEIMRDSHVGAFAVAGGASLLILKYGALLSLLVLAEESNHGKEWALFLFPMLSRWAMVVATVAFPYARRQGMGTPFHQGSTKLVAAIAAVVVIIASLFLGGIGGAGMLIGVSILAWALGLIMAHMLGGLTGDAYGAINEMAEVAILVAAVALIQYGLLEPLPQLLGGS